nr:protein tma23 [Quercus suber]
MDAQAYLRKHGWRGDGYSLDQSGRGIKKPLLVSKKVDVLGVGLNKHAAVSDQWWLRAFDNGLKNFGTGQESMLAAVQKHGVNRGGLYGRFVKGEGVAGTFGEPVVSSDTTKLSAPIMMLGATTGNDGPQKNDRKRKHAEDATDKQQSKQQRRTTVEGQGKDKINQAAQALVLEAETRGILPTGKQKLRVVETDPNDPLFEMLKSTTLSEHAQMFDTGDPSSAAYQAAEDQVKREFEVAAEAYLRGSVVYHEPTKPFLSEQARLGGVPGKRPTKLDRAAKKQQRLSRKQHDIDVIAASRSSKGELMTVREAASGCGIAQKDYVKKATGRPYSQYIQDNEKVPVRLEHWVELHRVSYPELTLASQSVKDYVQSVRQWGKKSMPRAAVTIPVTGHDHDVTEREQIDHYYAKKHRLTLEQYRSKVATGAIQQSEIDISSIDPAKLADYQQRANAKGIGLKTYIKRREDKYAAKQGNKLIRDRLQADTHDLASSEIDSATLPGFADRSVKQDQAAGQEANLSTVLTHSGPTTELAESIVTTESLQKAGGKAKEADKKKKAANKEQHALLLADRAIKRANKLARKVQTAASRAQGTSKRKKGAKKEKVVRMEVKKLRKKAAKMNSQKKKRSQGSASTDVRSGG